MIGDDKTGAGIEMYNHVHVKKIAKETENEQTSAAIT